MIHLNIQQATDRIEEVGVNVIEKLYQLAYYDTDLGITSQLDSSSDVSGYIKASAAYEESVLFLRERFPNLTIDVGNPPNYYVRFKDSAMEQLIVNAYGDGQGVTTSRMATVSAQDLTQILTISSSGFRNVKDFSDVQNFVGATTLNCKLIDLSDSSNGSWYSLFSTGSSESPDNFYEWMTGRFILNRGNLVFSKDTAYTLSVDQPLYLQYNWRYSLSFDKVDFNNATFMPVNGNYKNYAIIRGAQFPFSESTVPGIIQSGNFKGFLPNVCIGNLRLQKYIVPEGFEEIRFNCKACNVTYYELPTTTTKIYFGDYRRDATVANNSGWIVIKAVTPPEILENFNTYSKLPQAIYVPDGSVQAYKTAWSDDSTASSLVQSMKDMGSEKSLGTVTDEDIYRV